MINIEKFIRIRKKLGLSQNDLCDGICTQSTLSKFENNGRIPSMKILNSLCARMDINLSDIMLTSQNNEVATKLFEAEFATIQYDFPKVARILSKISPNQLLRQKDVYHYYYLRGMIALELDHDETDALYYFNSILNSEKIKANSIYYLLALKGCSQVYELQNDSEKADHYYQKLIKRIKEVEFNDRTSTLQLLSILCQAGEFYGREQKYDLSDNLLKYGYQICSDQHVIYFIARILYCLALNNKAENKDPKITEQYLQDTAAFARLNKNRVLLDQIQKLEN